MGSPRLDHRRKIMRESNLPYCFTYKMRWVFRGKKCPICKNIMVVVDGMKHLLPTVQHNKPITKGGKHEIENISIICHHCNTSIRNNETGKLNNARVIREWKKIVEQMYTEVYTNVRHSIDKSRIE